MAKLFYIHEVDELMTNKIKEIAMDAIMAEHDMFEDTVLATITALRHYKDFAKLIIEDMREKEADEDRLFAELRKETKTDKQEASDGTDS